MIPDFKLSKYIGFYEFTNTRNVGLLVENREESVPFLVDTINFTTSILDPIRELIGPYIVSSGFRCQKLNRLVGGVPTSKHSFGIAADIFKPEWDFAAVNEIGHKIYTEFIKRSISAKIIIEASRGVFWIHVNKDKELSLLEGIAGVYKKLA